MTKKIYFHRVFLTFFFALNMEKRGQFVFTAVSVAVNFFSPLDAVKKNSLHQAVEKIIEQHHQELS